MESYKEIRVNSKGDAEPLTPQQVKERRTEDERSKQLEEAIRDIEEKEKTERKVDDARVAAAAEGLTLREWLLKYCSPKKKG